MIFENFINFKCTKFIFWLFRNDGLCFTRNKFYFMKYSRFKKRLDDLCNANYNIVNVLDNDIEAIESRIYFIQDREPSSLYFIADV